MVEDTDRFAIRKDILEFYEARFREDHHSSHADITVCDFVSNDSQDKEWILAEIKLMAEEGLLRKDIATTGGGIFYFITSKGTEELETTYNPIWVEQQKQNKRTKRMTEFREKKKKEESEERKIKLGNKQYKQSYTLQKYGIVGSITVSAIAIMISVIALLK